MVLTPICPHTLTNRPLVFRPDSRLSIRNASGGPVTLTIDGQWGSDLPSDAWIDVRRADRPLRLYQAPRGFFGILREKLSWGSRRVERPVEATVQGCNSRRRPGDNAGRRADAACASPASR